jgi:hypothetical protein
MPSCTGTKPSYSGFVNSYLSYAKTASQSLGLPIAFVLCHWYQEWGIPANNPAWQTSLEGYTPVGYCGDFPMFQTLDDGVQAYIDQMQNYNSGNGQVDVFGQAVKLSTYFNDGFTGGLYASNVQTDTSCGSGCWVHVNVTSQVFGGGSLSGTYAANEGLGASAWNSGHYMLDTDAYTGHQLNVILNDAGWSNYCYVQ